MVSQQTGLFQDEQHQVKGDRMNDAEERNKFEHWYINYFPDFDHPSEESMFSEIAWAAWKARANLNR